MAVEAQRGCNFRKVGGFYLVADDVGFPCGMFPIDISRCNGCGCAVEQSRGFTWISPSRLFANVTASVSVDAMVLASELLRFVEGVDERAQYRKSLDVIARKVVAPKCQSQSRDDCARCPTPAVLTGDKAGLIWIGEKFYGTVRDFIGESMEMGISRRIPPSVVKPLLEHQQQHGTLPYILLAHSRCFFETEFELGTSDGEFLKPGVFMIFRPKGIEKIIDDTTPEEEQQALRDQGIAPVAVPASDPDHH